MFILILFAIFTLSYARLQPLHDISKLSKGEWMIEFFAPWCAACKQFGPTWAKFAEECEKHDMDLTVVQVDITTQTELAGRFFIQAIPSIYHVKDGEYRQYDGERSAEHLMQYVRERKYLETPPIPWWRSPNAFHMRFFTLIYKLSFFAKDMYELFHEEYHLADYLIYSLAFLAVIFVGVTLGLILVAVFSILETCFRRLFRRGLTVQPSRKAKKPTPGAPARESESKPAAAQLSSSSQASATQEKPFGSAQSQPNGEGQTEVRKRPVQRAE